jgi:hypothetical protein
MLLAASTVAVVAVVVGIIIARSWSRPTSSGAPDVEGAGPKARPAGSVASGPAA